MSFTPEFECDVFVSYATANDQLGWVTALRDAFKKFLDEALGRRNASEVWMDYKLRGNEPFDEQLRNQVTGSAVLLIVLSDSYLKSPWCRRELEIFLDAPPAGHSRAGCIFLVHYEPVPSASWFKGLQGLSDEKFRFFQQERDGAVAVPLGFPLPSPVNPAHATYYQRLLELSKELAAQLKKLMPSAPNPPPPPAPGPAVYLAEVTGDTLFDQRQLVKSHLEQTGLCALPRTTYPTAPAAYAEAIDRDLKECLVFVQMLGRFGTGRETLQHERAVAANKEVLRWRSRDLRLDTVPEVEQRRLLEGADVKALDFEELKRTIVERMRVLAVKPPAFVGNGAAESFVLINAAKEDVTLADAITQELANWNIGFDVVNGDISLREISESGNYDALMVIYGQCPYEWVHKQLIKCREILLSRRDRAPVCAVYIGPPENKEPLRCRPPRVELIDPHDKAKLQAFIKKLSNPEAAP